MPEFDLVIRGGTFVDGTGLPRLRADVGIKNGRVAMVSGRINGTTPNPQAGALPGVKVNSETGLPLTGPPDSKRNLIVTIYIFL